MFYDSKLLQKRQKVSDELCKMKFEVCPEINQLVDKRSNSDAYIIKQEGTAEQRKKAGKMMLKKRLKKNLRLKPVDRDTTEIMTNFALPQATKNLNAEDEDNFLESDYDSEDGGFGRKNWYDRRFAKDSPLLREDILKCFQEREVWTWD